MPSLDEIGPVVLVKKMKMWKVYRRTDRRTDRQTTDDRWSEKLTWALNAGELKKKRLEVKLGCLISRTGIYIYSRLSFCHSVILLQVFCKPYWNFNHARSFYWYFHVTFDQFFKKELNRLILTFDQFFKKIDIVIISKNKY